MKRLKRIIRWIVGLIVGCYLTIILLLSLPPFQTWMGNKFADLISEQLDTRVEVGRVQLGMTGRLIIDDIIIWDRHGKKMLTITRTGAKLSLVPLLKEGRIHINNALLFGAHAKLYQETSESAPNFQFVIDALTSEDEEKKPMPHIYIGSILVRHTSVSYDLLWKPRKEDRFDPSHIQIRDLSIGAQVHEISDERISIHLRRLSFREQSGLQVNDAEGDLSKEGDTIRISDFSIKLPESCLYLQNIQGNIPGRELSGDITANLSPRDFSAFHGGLREIESSCEASLSFTLDSTNIGISNLTVNTSHDNLKIDIPSASVNNLKDSSRNVSIKVNNLTFAPSLLHDAKRFTGELPPFVEPLVSTLGEIQLEGSILYGYQSGNVNARIKTAQGNADLEANLTGRSLHAQFNTDGLELGNIISALQKNTTNSTDTTNILGNIVLTAEADIQIPPQYRDLTKGSLADILHRLPSNNIKLDIHEAVVKNYAYHKIKADISTQRGLADIYVEANDPSLTFNFQGSTEIHNASNTLQGLLSLEHFRPQALHLTKSGLEDLRTKIGIDITGNNLYDMTGDISIPHVILTGKKGSYTLSSIQLESRKDEERREITLKSPYISAEAKGKFEWVDLSRYVHQTIHQWIPGIVKAPSTLPAPCQARFAINITDPSPLERIADIPLHLDKGPLQLNIIADAHNNLLDLEASAEHIGYGDENLTNFRYHTESLKEGMTTLLSAARIIKKNPVDIAVRLSSANQILTTNISWDDHKPTVTRGELAFRGNIQQEGSSLSIDGEVLPSSLQISDTLWNIKPTKLSFEDGVLAVEDFRMTMEDGNRWLAVHGKASKSPRDTIIVNLRGIELGYIFDLVHVKPLSLAGQVTGNLYGIHLFQQPEAQGHVVIPHLLFNEGDMGMLDADLAWGVTPGTLDIKALISDQLNNAWIKANGYLHLIKDPIQSLDLRFQCHRANLHFMNRYVSSIMKEVEGRATGNLAVYGTFGDVDLSGDADIEEAALTIPSLNTRYHVQNEHIALRPDGITLNNITGYDPMGGPGKTDHFATINGRISYSHFRNMRYNFNITGNNVLAYNFPEFDDLPFCGVVYGTGNVQLSGSPGQTTIDIDARPTNGTVMTYKVATPETLTQSKFITFVNHDEENDENDDQKDQDKDDDDEEDKPEGDMTINFNLDLNPEAEMRLLMDPIAGDYISLYGNSRLRATYYNKGSFRMYGTYRVDHGTYRMSIQDVIRKDFQFKPGGTIVFGGNPFQADLGLQAIYTVPSVSLNDLSARGTFSNNNVRVNCLMNLGGKAGEPRITFDFDIPNVNDDELRMVRSLISTEEERNMQVIYLLGIGRFYTYDYTGTQAQSASAMNSLLSSTLSGQLNQMFSSLMGGNQNWNIGANLSTGDMGWSDMDVEGMLSGRLLNNRLLINGNFGYRDNPVAASNFIGDFDLQWILNKHGNLILKAYSETNDRYFTRSALTTQGVGLQLKKDFIRWNELFKRKKSQNINQNGSLMNDSVTDKRDALF